MCSLIDFGGAIAAGRQRLRIRIASLIGLLRSPLQLSPTADGPSPGLA
ncbi:MAG: hypothetical protein R3E84_20910 [Pseudomonadales bacterium]